MIEKTTVLVFHANVCVNLRMSEIENRHSTFPMYACIKKKNNPVLFRAFQLPCDPSKPFLMQTQQKNGQLESAELSHSLLLSSLSLSDLLLWLHYKFSFCSCFIQFLCVMFLPSKHYSMNILTQVLMIQNIMEIRYVFARHSQWIKDDSCTALSVRVCCSSSVATDGFVSNFCERFLDFSLAQRWITSKPGESETTKTTKFWSGKESVWACAVCGQVQLCVCVCLY